MMARFALAFVVATLVIGVPYWAIPYDKFDLSHVEVLPGAILLTLLTMMLIGKGNAKARTAFLVMSMVAPAVDLIAIVHDTSTDPTTHNLAPFELIIAWAHPHGEPNGPAHVKSNALLRVIPRARRLDLASP